jgi:hypothetical protein
MSRLEILLKMIESVEMNTSPTSHPKKNWTEKIDSFILPLVACQPLESADVQEVTEAPLQDLTSDDILPLDSRPLSTSVEQGQRAHESTLLVA